MNVHFSVQQDKAGETGKKYEITFWHHLALRDCLERDNAHKLVQFFVKCILLFQMVNVQRNIYGYCCIPQVDIWFLLLDSTCAG